MSRLFRRLGHGAFYEIKRLVMRDRREQTDSRSPEGEYVPAFDPTLPTRMTSYGPRKVRGTSRTRRR
jgi:hypothetical protein